MRAPSWTWSIVAVIAASSVSSCGGDTVEPEPICARARILTSNATIVTPTGLVAAPAEAGWTVSRLEADGSLTPVTTLETSPLTFLGGGWLTHDPVSGRMWVLESDYNSDEPPRLYQFDASGQLEWMVELSGYERPVIGGSVLHHEGAIYLTLTMDANAPEVTGDPGVSRSLIVERRDLDGAVVWSRNDYARPNTFGELSSAWLVGVSGSTLSMVATPPLIDYGPSYPLSVDVETGDVLWSGEDGHDPLRMAVGDGQVYLGWVTPTQYDPDRYPDRVKIGPPSTSLSVHAPSTGAQANVDTVEWDAIDWPYPGFGGQNLALGWMGEELVSLLVSDGVHGVAIHDASGALVCQGKLDLEFDWIQAPGVGIEGRDQFVVKVRSEDGDPMETADDVRGLLVIEPGSGANP